MRLFGLAFIWIVIAVICDLRKREVPNWLNFSLIAFALAYRAFFSSYFNDWMFFVFGLFGFVMFFGLANLFYYSRMFAGGDAKLLMGLGAIIPIESFSDLAIVGFGFIFLLFFVGSIYSLIYSLFLVWGSYRKFSLEFSKNIKNKNIRRSFFPLVVISIVLLLAFIIFNVELMFLIFGILIAIFTLVLFVYAKSLDKCMIKKVSPWKLTEGDWIVGDIKIRGGVIKKTVHGLSKEDIIKLRKIGKEILIKEGIPFTPAFLIALLVMVFFFSALKAYLGSFFLF